MNFSSRKNIVFLILTGFFITNAIVAELIGGKLFGMGPFVVSVGILPWPVVFLTTDLMNEYFGKKGVRMITFLTAGLITYSYFLLYGGMETQAVSFSPVDDHSFNVVFGQSQWIIIGSIVAFIISQLIDIGLFWFFKKRTGDRMIWLRATGSTVISQLFDSFIVAGIAFWLTGKVTLSEYIVMAFSGYVVKLGIAILITPLIYAGHFGIKRYLRGEE